MAKRKRKPGERKGFKLRPVKDYRSEEYVHYIMNAEIGILQAATIVPELTDGQVDDALANLISQLKQPDAVSKLLPAETSTDLEDAEPIDTAAPDFVQSFILMNLRNAFEEHGPLNAEDLSGVLGVIKTSVKRWNIGMHRRGYISYLEDFLGQMGAGVQKLSQEEAEALGPDEAFEEDENRG